MRLVNVTRSALSVMGKLPSQAHKVGDAERLGARGGCDTASLKGGIEHVLGKAVGAHGIADGLATLSKCSINHACPFPRPQSKIGREILKLTYC